MKNKSSQDTAFQELVLKKLEKMGVQFPRSDEINAQNIWSFYQSKGDFHGWGDLARARYNKAEHRKNLDVFFDLLSYIIAVNVSTKASTQDESSGKICMVHDIFSYQLLRHAHGEIKLDIKKPVSAAKIFDAVVSSILSLPDSAHKFSGFVSGVARMQKAEIIKTLELLPEYKKLLSKNSEAIVKVAKTTANVNKISNESVMTSDTATTIPTISASSQSEVAAPQSLIKKLFADINEMPRVSSPVSEISDITDVEDNSDDSEYQKPMPPQNPLLNEITAGKKSLHKVEQHLEQSNKTLSLQEQLKAQLKAQIASPKLKSVAVERSSEQETKMDAFQEELTRRTSTYSAEKQKNIALSIDEARKQKLEEQAKSSGKLPFQVTLRSTKSSATVQESILNQSVSQNIDNANAEKLLVPQKPARKPLMNALNDSSVTKISTAPLVSSKNPDPASWNIVDWKQWVNQYTKQIRLNMLITDKNLASHYTLYRKDIKTSMSLISDEKALTLLHFFNFLQKQEMFAKNPEAPKLLAQDICDVVQCWQGSVKDIDQILLVLDNEAFEELADFVTDNTESNEPEQACDETLSHA